VLDFLAFFLTERPRVSRGAVADIFSRGLLYFMLSAILAGILALLAVSPAEALGAFARSRCGAGSLAQAAVSARASDGARVLVFLAVFARIRLRALASVVIAEDGTFAAIFAWCRRTGGLLAMHA